MRITFDRSKILLFRLLPLACILLIAGVAARAQYQIKSWTTDDGLPQNTVYSILQTADGYLWLTTLDGLVRFDGVKFTVFNKSNAEGIESNRFTKLILDGAGDLWIATETDFVTRYRQGKFQTFRLSDNERTNRINDLFLNSRRELFVSTESEILRWNGESFAIAAPVAGETGKDAILWSKTGTLWRANGTTLFRFENNRSSEYRLPDAKADTNISEILEDRRGRIWIGTQNAGLFVFENEKISRYARAGDLSEDISPDIEDADGNIWAGATIIAPDGAANRVTTAQGLSENLVTTVFQDREGNIWIGTVHRGLNRLNRQKVAFYSAADGLAAGGIYPIFRDRAGDVWLGGENLTKYHDGTFSLVKGREQFPVPVTAIAQDRAGRLWFGHWGGAYYYENGKFTDFTDKFSQYVAVYQIHADVNGALWFATGNGLYRYENDRMTRLTSADGLAGNDVKVLRESNDGTLWVGTYGGLTRIKDNVLTSYTKNDGLASDLVRSLHEDANGALWIGSYDGGLTRLKDGKFTAYTTNEGLFNDGVFQILEDDTGSFWISSNRGVYTVAKRQLNDFADGRIKRVESIAYGKEDGLEETECNGGQQPAGIKTASGELWFPTQSGVAIINPNRIKANPFAPPVIVESAKIDNETVSASDLIEIAPNKNNLEISYTALSFIKSEFVKFRYQLEGQDADWVEAGTRRTAYYSYLPPGEYVFRVVAANADGVWNVEGASVAVRIVPPFYRTWWFSVASLGIIFGTVFSFYRRRVLRLEKTQRTHEQFARQLLASQERERQRIASELHDSIGQSLLIMKNRASLALTDINEPETVKEQLVELRESAAGVIEECREISYNLRPYQISRFGLTRTLEIMFRRISEVTPIETVIELESIDNVFSAEAETSVYRIIQESVNNIIKHSKASEAGFFITRHTDEAVFFIQDDGCGFDKNAADLPAERRGGFGLIGMAERVRILGGSYEIESQIGEGTTIKIKLPVSPENERN